jgi:hypothetical protein
VPDDRWRIREAEGGVVFSLHVQPRAKRSEVAGLHGAALKLKIAAPAVGGAANRAVAEFLAEALRVSRSAVQILAGEKSREKTVRIEGACLSHVRHLLE